MRNRYVVPVIALAVPFIFFLIAKSYYYNTCQCQCKGHYNDIEVCGWACRMLSNPEAVFALLAIYVAGGGVIYLVRQVIQGNDALILAAAANTNALNAAKEANDAAVEANKAAGRAAKAAEDSNVIAGQSLDATKEATDLTRKSIELYISAERGKLSVANFQVIGNLAGPHTVIYEIRNLGRSPVEIIRMAHRAAGMEISQLQWHPPELAQRVTFESSRVAAQNGFTTRSMREPLVVENWPAGQNARLVIQGFIVYNTDMGVYRLSFASTFDEALQTSSPIIVQGYNTDLPEPGQA